MGFSQVGDARRLLKALQALEAALAAAADKIGGAGAQTTLQSRVESAELAGVAPHHSLLAAGHAAVKRLALMDASRELRLATEQLSRPRGDRYGLRAQARVLMVDMDLLLSSLSWLAAATSCDLHVDEPSSEGRLSTACLEGRPVASTDMFNTLRARHCRGHADEGKQAHALLGRVRLLLLGGGALARQESGRTSRAIHQPQAVEPEPAATPDDRCSSDDSWEVVEPYPAAQPVAAPPADDEAEVLRLVKGGNSAAAIVHCTGVIPYTSQHASGANSPYLRYR